MNQGEKAFAKHEAREEFLYWSSSVAELYMLWRDKELPMGASLPWNPDSDTEPNTVTTFWMTKPMSIMGRGIYLALDSAKISKENISEGKMRFTNVKEDYDGLNYSKEQIDEIYVSQRIPIENLRISISAVEKSLLEDYHSKILKTQKDLNEPDGEWTLVLDYEIQGLITHMIEGEFGSDPKNFPDGFKIAGYNGRVGPETYIKEKRIGTITFNLKGYHHALLSAILDTEYGIETRAGTIFNHRLVRRWFNTSEKEQARIERQISQGKRLASYGIVRASIGIHNTKKDIYALAKALKNISSRGPGLKYKANQKEEIFQPIFTK